MRHLLGGLALAVVLTAALSACAGAPRAPVTVGIADMGCGGSITLLDSPCAGKVRDILQARLRPEYRSGWRTADGVFFMLDTQGLKRFAGCWYEPPAKLTGGKRMVLVVFEDEDTFLVPREVFDGRPVATPGVAI